MWIMAKLKIACDQTRQNTPKNSQEITTSLTTTPKLPSLIKLTPKLPIFNTNISVNNTKTNITKTTIHIDINNIKNKNNCIGGIYCVTYSQTIEKIKRVRPLNLVKWTI